MTSTSLTSIISRVVGPIGARPLEGSAAVDDIGQGVDFTIGALGFKLAISDKHPYERATAQFKKDQFDSAPTPGEQGLVGWWLRSQLSFHKGAGLKYYEVLDGETVLNRSAASSGLDISTAGQVTLARAQGAGAVAAIRDARQVVKGTTNYLLFEKTTGAFTKATLGTSIASLSESALATSTGSTIQGMTHSATAVWVINGNKIEKLADPATSTTSVVLTQSDATNFVGVWWLKGRLWAVDANGYFYMKSDVVASFNNTTAYGTIGDYLGTGLNAARDWKATEAPNGILFARDNKVYLTTVDSTGASPVPSPPALVAELPTDESISAVRYSLGLVAIATGKGMRFATLDTNTLTYGPLVATGLDFSSCSTIGVSGDRFYVTGRDLVRQEAGAYSFNASNLVDVQQPAWALELPFPAYSDASASTGSRVTSAGILSWSSAAGRLNLAAAPASAYATSDQLAPVGTLLTGYHRYGTLEPKKFQSVSVRVGGTGGTVGVSRVMDDGSVVDLYTMNVVDSHGEDITLGAAALTERLALKFTLTRDAVDPTKGPELLGYQLRALPAPRRQRMLRVPLFLFDNERTPATRTTGHINDSWERLAALEDMESRGGTFQFKDFRTGEAGECYIETVEHQGMTPPTRGGNGYGGIVFLTLRKL